MSHRLVSPLLVLLACLISVSVDAEVLIVPGTNSAGVWSSPLTAGVRYRIESSGEYIFSGGGEHADAEWLHLINGQIVEFDPTPAGEWNAAERDVCDLFVDDLAVCWLGTSDGETWTPHTYSPGHVYRYYLTGQGAAVKFHVADPTPLSHTEWAGLSGMVR